TKGDVDDQQGGHHRERNHQRSHKHPAQHRKQLGQSLTGKSLKANGNGAKALHQHFNQHQTAVHAQKHQTDHHQVKLGQDGHRDAVARVHHGSKPQPHLHGDDLSRHHKQLKQHHHQKAHPDTDNDLVKDHLNGLPGNCVNQRQGPQVGYHHQGQQQRNAQPDPDWHH